MIKKRQNRLYLKISATLLSLLTVLGVVYILISSFVARQYYQEVNQKLYGGIADSTVQQVKPLVDGEVDTTAVKDIMHSLMVINPSVEVYLLDTLGNIITFMAPNHRVKLDRVDLSPIRKFIADGHRPFTKGDDPRHPGEQKVFSAAPILNEDLLEGYLYIILASEEQHAVVQTLQGSYMLQLGFQTFLLSLFAALVIGLIAIWYLTKNLRSIIATVQRFKEGDLRARVADEDKGDLVVLADTFNGMADRIVENIDKLKSVENLRRELIANVSHDLRTPLSIMQGYVETLLIKENNFSTEERRKHLQTVLGSSEKLSNLIHQLFEYSKLEAKQVEPHKEAFFISELAHDIFQKYQLPAREKNIDLRLEMPNHLPLVFADVSLVERVIQNLMDNALKFTPEYGQVSLVLSEVGKEVEVKISDTGPGIAEEEQTFIFERYHQATRERSHKSGAGLGLAIAKKILELHDATIRVQSKLNEGTTFLFHLPARG